MIYDVQPMVLYVCTEPFVWLKNPFDELQSNGILEISGKVSQEEEAFFDDAYVGILQNTYVARISTLFEVWLELVPNPLLIAE